MSNLSKERQAALLKILHFIQNGGDLATAKKLFKQKFDQVDVSEITSAERALIAHGLDPRQIQYLCNVHAEMFKGNIKNATENADFSVAGHPVNTIKQENTVIQSLINDYLLPNLKKWESTNSEKILDKIQTALADLATIDKHYSRKEISIFPLMNKYGITAPPEVMWGVDNKIRNLIKQAQNIAATPPVAKDKLRQAVKAASHEVLKMIFKEEKIMIPLIDEVATANDWYIVKQEEKEIGYTLISQPMNWRPKQIKKASSPLVVEQLSALYLNFEKGKLNLEQLTAILAILPFALIFVDENDKVAFFGGGANIFPHSRLALGNSVFSCHLPQSQPIVKHIFQSFHSGQRSMFESWVTTKKSKKMFYLRYYAVKNKAGKYLGCLEVAEDITKINNLKGKKE